MVGLGSEPRGGFDLLEDSDDRRLTGVGLSGSGGGPGSWGPGGWGPGGFGGPGGHGGRGERAPRLSVGRRPEQRGDPLESLRLAASGGRWNVLAAILLLLDEWPMRRSRLTREMSERSGTSWAVGRASMAAAMESLERAGLVGKDDVEDFGVAHLTRRGAAFVAEHRGRLGEPWDDVEYATAAATGANGTARSGSGAGTRAPRAHHEPAG